MTTTISRKRATEAIDMIMTQLYHISLSGAASSAGDQVSFVTTIQELVQLRFEDDYIAALNGMSMEAFTEYYNLFFELTKAMGLESVKDLSDYKVVSTKTLPDSLAKAKKTGDVVELLDGFNTFELSSIPYSDRIKSLERILSDWFWLGDKDQQIIKIIASMSAEEQSAFLSRLMNGKDPLLPKLLNKVDGPEKLSMFLFLQTIFLMSGMNADSGVAGPTIRSDPRHNSYFSAAYAKGTIGVTQYGLANSYGDVKKLGEWKLSPFTQVTYANADKSFTVPAFFLTDQEVLATAIGEETLLSVIWGALQGEFNEDPTGKQILADIGINFIPIVGQICDARDIAACLDKLINQKRLTETMVWITLILTAIGCIPYAGDVVKGALKAILKGADDVALILVKKIGGDNVAIAIKVLVSKLDDSLPEIRKLIQGWAADAAKKGSPNAAEFFAKMDEMIDAAVREIRTKIDEFGKKVGGETDEIGQKALNNIPKSNGTWCGTAGNSKWIPDDNFVPLNTRTNPDKLSWKQIKEKYGIDSITFKSGEPDLTKVSKGKVELKTFVVDRDANFDMADVLLAKIKKCEPDDVQKWRKNNKYTWHESKDCKTLLKVPTEVHGNIVHAGGISEIKKTK